MRTRIKRLCYIGCTALLFFSMILKPLTILAEEEEPALHTLADIDWDSLAPEKDYQIDETVVTFSDTVEKQEDAFGIAEKHGCSVRYIKSWRDEPDGRKAVLKTIDGTALPEKMAELQAEELISGTALNMTIKYPFGFTRPAINWEKDVEGVHYVAGKAKIIFYNETEDYRTAWNLIEEKGCTIEELSWETIWAGKYAIIRVADGQTVKDTCDMFLACDDVWYADPILPAPKQDIGWERLAGNSRYETMQAIARQGWLDNVGGTVILATGASFPDALTGLSLAGLYDAPILLTRQSTLSKEAAEEIQRINPRRVIILGGEEAVSSAVETQVAAMVGKYNVTRIAGYSRYDTSYRIYEAGLGRWSKTVLFVTGRNPADAMTVSSYAYASHTPVFLVKSNGTIMTEMKQALLDEGVEQAVIIGGMLGGMRLQKDLRLLLGEENVIQIAGNDRYETSSLFAEWVAGHKTELSVQPDRILSYAKVGAANGNSFPDALTGGALCGKSDSIFMLVKNRAEYQLIDKTLEDNLSIFQKGYLFGGEQVLSDALMTHLSEITETK